MRISDWSSDVCSSDLDIEQRWFSGVHSDIGGGYPEKESGLSKIPLIWMTDEAEKAGLRVTESNLAKFAHGAPPDKNEHQSTKPAPAGTLHKSQGLGWTPLEIIPKTIKYPEVKTEKMRVGKEG